MPPRTRVCLVLTTVIWLCLLLKLLFYSSFIPLWEGYDEFPHFAFVQYLTAAHRLPELRNAKASEEVAESLRLAPVPWTIRHWTPGWITYEDLWRLPLEVRQKRERELKAIPRMLGREWAPDLRLYEAQQPPLAYLLYWLPYAAFEDTDILTRAWLLRIAGSAIASLVIPFGFIVARRILADELQAVGVVAVIAAMPEFMLTADHGGNEPLAIVLGTACVYGFSLVSEESRKPLLRALILGVILGCGLLTKAYFLAVIPALFVIEAALWWRRPASRRRIAVQLLAILAAATAIAGWWYARAIIATGTLTGDQFATAARQSTTPLLRAVAGVDWRRVADFALFSHIWLGGWSFLVLRTWMYRIVEFVLFAAGVGLAVKVLKHGPGRLAGCIALQFFFWLGLAYHAFHGYLATGDAAVGGYYAYALVVPEAMCLIGGIAALLPQISKRFIAPVLVLCFSAVEVFGTVFCLMPYYGGLTGHTSRGTVPVMHIGQLSGGGTAELFRNLAVNKPGFLSSGVLVALCLTYVLAIAGIIAVSVLSASRRKRSESGSTAEHRFVPLGSG